MRTRNPAFGLGLVVGGALLFVLNAGVSRVALRAGVDPVPLATVRITGTFAALLVVAVLFRRDALRPPGGRLGALVVVHGLLGVAGLQVAYFVALDRLPVGMALLLEYQAPVLVALWARFVQREPVRPRLWAGLVLATAGLATAAGIGQRAAFDAAGVLAGLTAAVCLSVYFLLGEHGVNRLDPLQVVLWSFGCGALGLNLVHPVTGIPPALLTRSASLLGPLAGLHAPVWAVLAWVVLLGTLAPFAAELFALRHLPATVVTLAAMLEPVGVSVLGWLWFGEVLDAVALLGGAAVVIGIVLAQSARRAVVPAEPPLL